MIAVLYVGGLLLLLGLSAFFAGAETAIVGIPHYKVHRMVKENAVGAQPLHRLKKNMRRTLTTILIVNNISNVVISSFSMLLAIEVMGSIGISIGIGVISLIILTFGEIFPKTISTAYTEKVAGFSAPAIESFVFVFSPLAHLLQAIPDKLLKKTDAHAMVTEKEMHELMQLGLDENVLERAEVRMIKKVLQFNDTPLKDVMTPIDRVAKIDQDESVEFAINLVSLQNHTRYPLINKDGRIVGSLRAKHLFRHAYKGKEKKVSELADKPLFLDEQIKIDDAFGMMRRSRQRIAYVTDSADKVLGVVTAEDVLEELVGEY